MTGLDGTQAEELEDQLDFGQDLLGEKRVARLPAELSQAAGWNDRPGRADECR
jgi:hypothetical protein